MRIIYKFASLALLCVWVSCKVAPEQINYGSDACHFCKMTIVDQQHSAQYVTKKGKQFKFDAIECLVNELAEKDADKIGILLVADYLEPGQMTSATTATYLISKEIKSPMGAYLSALSSSEKAKELQQKYSGETYSWESLKQQLSDK